jgi:hypothetical protein
MLAKIDDGTERKYRDMMSGKGYIGGAKVSS